MARRKKSLRRRISVWGLAFPGHCFGLRNRRSEVRILSGAWKLGNACRRFALQMLGFRRGGGPKLSLCDEQLKARFVGVLGKNRHIGVSLCFLGRLLDWLFGAAEDWPVGADGAR